MDDDMIETEESLSRVTKVCKFINILMKVILAVFCLFWIIAVGSMAYALFVSDASGIDSVGIFQVFLFLGHGVVIAFLMIVLIGVFSDVAKGQSPFTMTQVRRIRIIAALLLVYAVLDIAIMQNNTLLTIQGFNSGYLSTSGTSILQINFGPIIAAGAVYAFSFVFKYGVLLQEFSDDTV